MIQVPNNWLPRPHQRRIWNYMQGGGKKADWCAHRRSGKDILGIAWYARDAISNPGVYWHILPKYSQARKAIWDGRMNDGRAYLDIFPKEIIKRVNNQEMKIELINDSIWQLQGADEPDRLVGTNPRGIALSEWSLMNPEIWTKTLQPILAANNGSVMFLYTPRGENHAYEQREKQTNNPAWFVERLTVEDTQDDFGRPIVSPGQIEQCKVEGMSEALIQQEFYCSFNAPMEGAYYGEIMTRLEKEDHITNVPWEPKLDVHTAWDLGMADMMSIWFYQQTWNETRIIDYYENSGEGLAHYAKILKEKPYHYHRHWAPHDITVRELGTGRSRIDVARSMGIRFTPLIKHDVDDGIEAVRNLLPRCWFDKEKCRKGIRALKSYRKEWNEEKRVFSRNPLHDESSHPADAFRILSMGHKDVTRTVKPMPRKAIDEYSIFG